MLDNIYIEKTISNRGVLIPTKAENTGYVSSYDVLRKKKKKNRTKRKLILIIKKEITDISIMFGKSIEYIEKNETFSDSQSKIPLLNLANQI